MGKSLSKNNSEEYRGKRYGRLTVIGFEYVKQEYYDTKTAHWNWICRCDCGNIVSVVPSLVKNGYSRSCGCYKIEKTIERNKKEKVKHGGRGERLYYIWHGMKSRCYCPTNKNFGYWGGRGITVCDEWKEDYSAFRSWALDHGYNDNLSIDRVDVNGNYSPDNCRWATWGEQARNRTSSVYVEYNGENKTIAEWADILSIPYGTLYRRLFFDCWDVERAFTQPVRKRSKNVK